MAESQPWERVPASATTAELADSLAPHGLLPNGYVGPGDDKGIVGPVAGPASAEVQDLSIRVCELYGQFQFRYCLVSTFSAISKLTVVVHTQCSLLTKEASAG